MRLLESIGALALAVFDWLFLGTSPRGWFGEREKGRTASAFAVVLYLSTDRSSRRIMLEFIFRVPA